jgi:hypothetical protein
VIEYTRWRAQIERAARGYDPADPTPDASLIGCVGATGRHEWMVVVVDDAVVHLACTACLVEMVKPRLADI